MKPYVYTYWWKDHISIAHFKEASTKYSFWNNIMLHLCWISTVSWTWSKTALGWYGCGHLWYRHVVCRRRSHKIVFYFWKIGWSGAVLSTDTWISIALFRHDRCWLSWCQDQVKYVGGRATNTRNTIHTDTPQVALIPIDSYGDIGKRLVYDK